MDGFKIAGGTIPPNILVTNQRPDLVVLYEETGQIAIVELTIPFETNIEDAHNRKEERYRELVQDLQDNSYDVTFLAIEVGARGQVDRCNKLRFKRLLKLCNSPVRPRDFIHKVPEYAVLSSFTIFYARKERVWGEVAYLDL